MKTIAILYPGDMGHNIADALVKHGYNVVSHLIGRSEETKANAEKIGIKDCRSLRDVAEQAVLIFSLVPPAAVKKVAEAYIEACSGVGEPALFVDMNAKSIATAREIAGLFSGAGLPFTNACIIGRAAFVADEGVIYCSGENTTMLEDISGKVFRVVNLGREVAAATAFKMCFAGFNKTITAAVFETATAANYFGITARLFEEIDNKLPGIIADISRTTGSYPKHLSRRKQEMQELDGMLSSLSLPNHIAQAAARTFAEVEKRGDFEKFKAQADTPFPELMEALNKHSV